MAKIFKIGEKVYCIITLRYVSSTDDNDTIISPGFYTISDIRNYSSGIVYKLKEFENTNKFNQYHNSCFISIKEYRKYKLNQINKNIDNDEI